MIVVQSCRTTQLEKPQAVFHTASKNGTKNNRAKATMQIGERILLSANVLRNSDQINKIIASGDVVVTNKEVLDKNLSYFIEAKSHEAILYVTDVKILLKGFPLLTLRNGTVIEGYESTSILIRPTGYHVEGHSITYKPKGD